ncbi:MAG: 2Fe-2S iron-sulfur cluster-binding protein, partial [Actinomycetes bacterium]
MSDDGQPVSFRPYKPPYVTHSAVGTSPPSHAKTGETVTISIDGRERVVPKGQLIITAADSAGVYIPRFCYHPRM